eukprot:CAMPEP_0171225764 /NCGR_PEP_ID=MMETSP0790-20130122/36974_1 /TAXON_ID=2925 /ORGANISM="Alexandrium catenella, Strain OF101" /LENGTH=217 /DNA_ID=CAMNT_0011691805 /DNA_START=117 /DNA_END=770 /DNA_ORIENTATION=+
MASFGLKSGGFGGGNTGTAVDRRIAMAMRHKQEGDEAVKRGMLIDADEAYDQAVQLLETMTVKGEPASQSGEEREDKALASCFAAKATGILEMAEGKGLLPDGTPFKRQFSSKADFDYFRKQALKQAEESAEKACVLYADEISLFNLGSARFQLCRSGNDPLTWMRPEDAIDNMKEAGRCFLKSMKAKHTEKAQKSLEEVKAWLKSKNVTSLFPEYV